MYSRLSSSKRIIDFIVSLTGLIILSPLILWVSWRVMKDVGSPVFFRQIRPGLFGEPFTIIKFRTMRDEVGPDGKQLSDSERLTDFGRFLRRTSLDELPELWNVLRGDMSLVGPRPLLMEYLPLYSSEQMKRHEARPGITGWAQVNGRQHAPFSQRFEMDAWYITHWSLVLDMKILAMTVVNVLRGSGVESGQDVLTVDDLGFNRPQGKCGDNHAQNK